MIWQDPEFKAKTIEVLREGWQGNLARKVKASAITREQMKDLELRANLSKMQKGLWQDPGKRALRIANLSGENSSQWKGGRSFEPYSLDFTEALKQVIRERDNYTCAICGKWGNQIHHANYNKQDSRPENLVTLCTGCHPKTNNKREYWEALLAPIAIERSKQGTTVLL